MTGSSAGSGAGTLQNLLNGVCAMSANKYKTNHERMLELIEKLNVADIAYYLDAKRIMSYRD